MGTKVATKTNQTNPAGATIVSTTGGNNVIQASIIYYIKFTISLPDKLLSANNSFPYIWVYSTEPKEELGFSPEWKVVKTGTSNGGVTLPVSEEGQYRLYIREPKTTHKIDDSFTPPYHMGTGFLMILLKRLILHLTMI